MFSNLLALLPIEFTFSNNSRVFDSCDYGTTLSFNMYINNFLPFTSFETILNVTTETPPPPTNNI